MEDIKLINGSWSQTIAYMLSNLDSNILSKLDEQLVAINQYAYLSGSTNGKTNVIIEEYFNNIPPKYVINVIDDPIPIFKPEINVTLQRKQLPQQIIKVNITNRNAYNRICGQSSGSDSKLQDCFECVNKWINEHPNYELKDFTSSKIGCFYKKRSCP